ncbi:MAG TPA: patatin-like phospholipase family protein [Rhizomicrobium sp.]|jgi:NTE family protein|nr:patatin-like phospholipase family protein [Rhizomicrobium sp.]
MAFLSSFRTGFETVYPDSLRDRLRSFPLLKDVSEPVLKRLLGQASWFGLPGGTLLARDGANDRALFLVVTGSLGVFVEDEKAQRRLVARISAGETVGEMSLISGEPHTAQLVALRDTELLRISREGFQALMARYPNVILNLMRILVHRLQQTARRDSEETRPRSFAIVPLQDGLRDEPIAARLAAALGEMGSNAAVLDVSAAERPAEWFNLFEAAHDIVFYRGDAPDSAWTHHCMRQADRVFLLARADRPLPRRPPEIPAFKARVGGPPELLLLHPGGALEGLPEQFSLRSGLFVSHHHLRAGATGDIRRLARFVAGRAVGLVLAGGGARGYAHIGVIQALAEAEVPFDHLGGTSMGAVIAAGLAAEWSLDELTARMRDAFVVRNPLSDFTLPLIALLRGKQVSERLQEHFGERRIEELPKPFFCVSSDLTTGRIHVHRSGLLWRALRASVALPGILPPVTHRGHLLVDGGVMNNLPVDVMALQARGPIIASDVTGEVDLHVADSRYGERPIWWLLWQRMRGTPSIVSILMRSGTVGSEAQRRIVREQADFLFEPPLSDIGLRDWKSLDQAIAEGYAHARTRIDQHGVPLSDLWTEGPAVAVPHKAAFFPGEPQR